LKTFLKIVQIAYKSNETGNDVLSEQVNNAKSHQKQPPQLKKPQTTLNVQSPKEYRQIKAHLTPTHYAHLTRLNIQNAKLADVPSTIQNLKTLVFLELSQNEIKTFRNLKNLVCLKELNLSKNQLVDIDTEIFEITMPNLVLLDLSYNKIDSIRQSFCRIFRHLTTLKLNNNSIVFLNNNFGHLLPTLKFLYLSNNKLKFLPYSMTNLRLETLELQMNDFQEIDANESGAKLNRLYPTLTELVARVVLDKR
jgi:Leucine-rich repeat (LRR) protein